jgi:hypothetical protein
VLVVQAAQSHGFAAIDRWEQTASGPAVARGEPVLLTWSLAPDGASIRNQLPSSLIGSLDSAFGYQDAAPYRERPWFSQIEAAFARWSQVGGVTFRYEESDDGEQVASEPGELGRRGDVRLAAAPLDGRGRTLAISQFPDTADITFDLNDLAALAGDPRAFRQVLMHEIGHTLGLGHVNTPEHSLLMEPALDSLSEGPQLDDIRGLHRLYGDRYEWMDLPVQLGPLLPNENVLVGASGSTVGQWIPNNASDFVSIDGIDDEDFFEFSLTTPTRLTASITPWGGIITQGVDDGPTRLVDAGRANNLNFFLYDEAGSLLAPAYSAPRGQVESLTIDLAPGAYRLRVIGLNDAVQLYQLAISAEALPTPEPTASAYLFASLCVCAKKPRRRFART